MHENAPPNPGQPSRTHWLQRLVDVQPEEMQALGLAWLYVVALFVAYYVLRPIRDEFGASGGVENLPWLFTGTLGAMLVLSPLYGTLVKHWSRSRFIAIAYRFFMLNLLGFAALLHWGNEQILLWAGRVFFIWVSVFNLFVVSVFWSLMVDVFDKAQSKRLFGFLAAGATLGGMLGSAFVSGFAGVLGPYALLLLAMLLLEVAVHAARRLSQFHLPENALAPATEAASPASTSPASTSPASTSPASTSPASTSPASTSPASASPTSASPASTNTPVHQQADSALAAGESRTAPGTTTAKPASPPDDAGMGGSAWSGLTHTLRSPYLLGISAFILLYTVTSTFLYFQQAEIANQHFSSRAERTAFFANIDLWVNGLTLLFQLAITGHLMKRLGVIAVLTVLPLLSVAGFAGLALFPSLAVFVAVQVARRVTNFAFAKPAREVLFTQVPREDRYKAKNFIDTVVYRSGDQIGSWGYAGLSALGLGAVGISWVAVPLCLAWVGLSVWLGLTHERRS